MFGSIGPWEIMIILLIALMVVGPGKLPDVARSIGKGLTEFKKVTSGVRKEFEDVLKEDVKPAAPVYKTDAVNPLDSFSMTEVSEQEVINEDQSAENTEEKLVENQEENVDDKSV